MICPNCGKDINRKVRYCPYCDGEIKKKDDGKAGIILLLISFVLPVVGAVLYLCWDMNRPVKSKQCGKAALFGFIVYLIILFSLKQIGINFIRKLFEQFATEIQTI